VKTYRVLTLVAALLITLSEVVVFNSQSARGPEEQVDAGAASELGSGRGTHRSLAGAASIYWAVAESRNPQGVR
jgi:hypothetical protein